MVRSIGIPHVDPGAQAPDRNGRSVDDPDPSLPAARGIRPVVAAVPWVWRRTIAARGR